MTRAEVYSAQFVPGYNFDELASLASSESVDREINDSVTLYTMHDGSMLIVDYHNSLISVFEID